MGINDHREIITGLHGLSISHCRFCSFVLESNHVIASSRCLPSRYRDHPAPIVSSQCTMILFVTEPYVCQDSVPSLSFQMYSLAQCTSAVVSQSPPILHDVYSDMYNAFRYKSIHNYGHVSQLIVSVRVCSNNVHACRERPPQIEDILDSVLIRIDLRALLMGVDED